MTYQHDVSLSYRRESFRDEWLIHHFSPILDSKVRVAIATSGKAELLFPRPAASAETLHRMVTELQKSADKVKVAGANAQKLGDVPDAITAVKTALDNRKPIRF